MTFVWNLPSPSSEDESESESEESEVDPEGSDLWGKVERQNVIKRENVSYNDFWLTFPRSSSSVAAPVMRPVAISSSLSVSSPELLISSLS